MKHLIDTPQIWSLHAVTARKLAVTGVFGLASMSVSHPVDLGHLLYRIFKGPNAYSLPAAWQPARSE